MSREGRIHESHEWHEYERLILNIRVIRGPSCEETRCRLINLAKLADVADQSAVLGAVPAAQA
jgi:hypothetical protein